MSDEAKGLAGAGGLASAGLIAALSVPGLGLALIIAAGIILLVLLGMFVWIYITLQSLHLITPIVFTLCTLFMFYIGTKSKTITEATMHKYPWLPLLIPGSFLIGYLLDYSGNMSLTVSSLATATPQQGSINAVAIFTLVVGILYVANGYLPKHPQQHRRRSKRN